MFQNRHDREHKRRECFVKREKAFEKRRRLASSTDDVTQFDFSELKDVIREPILFRALLEHQKERMCEENLLFWKEVDLLTEIPVSEQLPAILRIYMKFIKEGSKMELNLECHRMELIRKQVKNLQDSYNEEIAENIFTHAKLEILRLIHSDSWQTFRAKGLEEARKLLFRFRGEIEVPHQFRLSPYDWEIIKAGGKEKPCCKGEILITQGETNSMLFVLIQGELQASKKYEDGFEYTLPIFDTPGRVLSELSMFPNIGASTTIMVHSNTAIILQIRTAFLHCLCKAQPELGARLYNFIGKQISVTISETEMLLLEKKPQRKISIEVPHKISKTKKKEKTEFRGLINEIPETLLASYPCIHIRPIRRSGTLFISQHFLIFSGSLFGQRTKEFIFLSNIEDIQELRETEFCVQLEERKNKFKLESKETRNTLVSLLRSMVAGARNSSPELVLDDLQGNEGQHEPLTEEEWSLILNPDTENNIDFVRGDCVIQEGFTYKAILQIVSGTCRVEKELQEHGMQVVIGTMKAGEFMGEINFFTHKAASASVVVSSKKVEMYLIDKEYLWNTLYNTHPDIVYRFYYHLSMIVAQRLAKYK